MHRRPFFLGLSLFLATSSASAIQFDLLVPARVELKIAGFVAGFGYPNWGALVATQDSISLEMIASSVATGAASDPQVSLFVPGLAEANAQFYTPLATGEVAGTGTNTTIPHPLFLDLLESGETFKAPGVYAVYDLSVSFPRGHEGVFTVHSTLQIGAHIATYDTIFELEFVGDDAGGASSTMIEAQRVTAEHVRSDLEFDPGNLEIKFPVPAEEHECGSPRPPEIGCGQICKPCTQFLCEDDQWVAHDVMWNDGLCRSQTGSTKWGAKSAKPEAATVCPRTEVGLCPDECDLCF